MACCTSSTNDGSNELGACENSELVSVAFTVLIDSNCEGSKLLALDVIAASAVVSDFGELEPHRERFLVWCTECVDSLGGKERILGAEGALKSDCEEYWQLC